MKNKKGIILNKPALKVIRTQGAIFPSLKRLRRYFNEMAKSSQSSYALPYPKGTRAPRGASHTYLSLI